MILQGVLDGKKGNLMNSEDTVTMGAGAGASTFVSSGG